MTKRRRLKTATDKKTNERLEIIYLQAPDIPPRKLGKGVFRVSARCTPELM
jgi:hypothetical protein